MLFGKKKKKRRERKPLSTVLGREKDKLFYFGE
jgi:hypothetical protein